MLVAWKNIVKTIKNMYMQPLCVCLFCGYSTLSKEPNKNVWEYNWHRFLQVVPSCRTTNTVKALKEQKALTSTTEHHPSNLILLYPLLDSRGTGHQLSDASTSNVWQYNRKNCRPAFVVNKLIPAVCRLTGPAVCKQSHRQTKLVCRFHCLYVPQNSTSTRVSFAANSA